MRKITFRNEVQRTLFEKELRGQISDGYWENARPHNHWEAWCEAEVAVGPNVGRNFSAVKDNYDFNASLLIDVVGYRMLEACRKVAGPDFSMAQMRRELQDMKHIVRVRVRTE